MKRIVVISILLGIIPICAQAAIGLALDGNPAPGELDLALSSIISIGGISSDSSPYTVFLELEDPGTKGEWIGEPIKPPGEVWPLEVVPDYGYSGIFMITVGSIIEPPTPGLQWEVDFHCLATGDAYINLYADDQYTLLDSITIHQVPEPMSVLLLGIGGLLLRRRKSA